jgi:hypothetical protein
MQRFKGRISAAVINMAPGGQIVKSVQDNITAAATQTQAAATQLTAANSRVVTNAAAGNGVKLPLSVPGYELSVSNAHATNAVQVYGTAPDTINGVATATGVSIPATKSATFFCHTAGAWHMQLGA